MILLPARHRTAARVLASQPEELPPQFDGWKKLVLTRVPAGFLLLGTSIRLGHWSCCILPVLNHSLPGGRLMVIWRCCGVADLWRWSLRLPSTDRTQKFFKEAWMGGSVGRLLFTHWISHRQVHPSPASHTEDGCEHPSYDCGGFLTTARVTCPRVARFSFEENAAGCWFAAWELAIRLRRNRTQKFFKVPNRFQPIRSSYKRRSETIRDIPTNDDRPKLASTERIKVAYKSSVNCPGG